MGDFVSGGILPSPQAPPTVSAPSFRGGFRSCPLSNMGRREQKSRFPFLPPQQLGTAGAAPLPRGRQAQQRARRLPGTLQKIEVAAFC